MKLTGASLKVFRQLPDFVQRVIDSGRESLLLVVIELRKEKSEKRLEHEHSDRRSEHDQSGEADNRSA